MANNSYANLLGMFREEGRKYNPPSLQLATVISIDPLLIKVGDLQLNKNNFLISEHLLDYARKVNFTNTVSGNLTAGEHSGTLNNLQIENKEMILKSTLNIGDTLTVIEINDGQTYIVLGKVINI